MQMESKLECEGKSDLIVRGLWDVNRKWRHISGLPRSSKEVHEVVIEVPYKKSDHETVLGICRYMKKRHLNNKFHLLPPFMPHISLPVEMPF